MAVSKRCRPLLGTFVEVTLGHEPGDPVDAWMAAAYAAVEGVQGAMSFHDDGSALSRLNGAPVGEWVEVPEGLARVLEMARELEEETNGVFSVAVGRPLVRWGFLPGAAQEETAWLTLRGSFEVVPSRARRLTDALLDLGGIAKGFAVDEAVEALQRLCPPRVSGVVNAGGDLRAFGPATHPVVVRGDTFHELTLRDAALATTSTRPQASLSPYVDTRRQRSVAEARTVVVKAPRCVVADALTKIALLADESVQRRVADRYQAEMGALP